MLRINFTLRINSLSNFSYSFEGTYLVRTSEQALQAFKISVVTRSTRFIGAVKSSSILSFTIRSKARSGVKRPERTPRVF